MESKFTPGEWHYKAGDSGFIRADGIPICQANICLHEYEANARLIAASPLLYKACVKLLEQAAQELQIPVEEMIGHVYGEAQAAIALADGKS